MIDFVFPNKNEKEFIEMAEELGYSSLLFIYENKIPHLDIKSKIKIYKSLLNKHSKEISIYENAKENRELFENKKIDIIFNLENNPKQDFMHHRASGFNHILANLANKNRIAIAFSFNSLKNDQAVKMGRMMQNIALCKKYKVKMCFASFAKDPYEMRPSQDKKNLGILLGIPQDNKPLDTFLDENLKRKAKLSFEGIEIIE